MAILLSELQNDPRKYRIDGLFFRRLYQLCKPFWVRRDAWKSWLIALSQVGMIVVFSTTGAYFSEMGAKVTNALVGKQQELYWTLFTAFTLLGLLRFGGRLVQQFVGAYMDQSWWRWLTAYLIDDYLANRTYYEITLDDQIDNPDQRIQEEVSPMCTTATGIPYQLLGSVTDMGVQGFILMSISPLMFHCVLVYALLQTFVTYYLYKPTIKQNFDITVAEADLRYGLTHVRENAENIAFYQGESVEREHLLLRMRNATIKRMRLYIYGVYMQLVQQASGILWTAMPLVVLVPLYFEGSIDYGVIGQATLSAGMLLSSLSVFMNFIPTLSQAMPSVIRLAEIHEKMIALDEVRRSSARGSGITLKTSDTARVDHLSLQTPHGEQMLVHDLNLVLGKKEHLVIVGRTGIGKSSLLRAMAGLWRRGEGTICLPEGGRDCLFLPQRPYTFYGSLRSQLCYPLDGAEVDDERLVRLLDEVALEQLLEKQGGLDVEKDWSRVLSLGEQQRIAFARVLLVRPRYLFLDEASSALDGVTEARLYNRLRELDLGYISIGHRQSLLSYHDRALCLKDGGGWELLPAERVQLNASEAEL